MVVPFVDRPLREIHQPSPASGIAYLCHRSGDDHPGPAPYRHTIMANLISKGDGLRDLILEVVTSESFRVTGQPTTVARY